MPAGTADHKFTTPIYAVASKNGMSCTSNTLNIDVHELWIKTFQDAGTGRAWRVCIASNISYEAYASSDCTSWSWQMPDGIFSCAWNPTGGNTKSGTSMQIPNSDKARASNSWFGTAYGTVYVYCVDGAGNGYSFYSTSMSPSQKVQVYFDPMTGVDGLAPSQQNPPAWFVFWRQGNVVDGMSNFSYMHDPDNYGEYLNGVLYLCPAACGTNNGPQTLTDMHGNPFTMTGTGQYLFCVSQTMSHESYHKYIYDNYSGLPQSDTDGITDAEEVTPSQTYFPASDPLNCNTFGFSYAGGYQDNEVRCRIKELHDCPSIDVNSDWSANSHNAKWVDP